MKRNIIALALGLVALAAQAAPVDAPAARRAATGFVRNTLRVEVPVSGPVAWHYEGLHLFRLGEGGFIIVAADDAARPVLAYSLQGAFTPTVIPTALWGLLDTYEAEIAAARRLALPPDPAWQRLLSGQSLLSGAKDVPTAVGPLVTTQWGQYAPYNNLCPSGVPSGCVATSTTQVMRYWAYPAFGQGSHSYNCSAFGNLSADFAHIRYDWANMPDVAGSSAVERNAVAVLTYQVGVSVNMDYNFNQSGATTGGGDNCALEALRGYFHYNRDDISYHVKGTTTDSAWTSFLMAELRHLRPILYDGVAGAFGGHSFICDGFDSLRMMHFNLGEFGEGDGYYAVGAITYMQLNLNSGNAAIIGIHPEYGLYASDTVLAFHRSGGTQGVWVSTSDTCSAPWSATAGEGWITLSDTSFDHLGEMAVSLAPNTTGAERTGTIALSQGPFATTIAVRQAAFDSTDFCTLTVHMESGRNQAWTGGAQLSFESPAGLVYATATHSANGPTSEQTVRVAPTDVVVRFTHGGPLDRYYNYSVIGPGGDTLLSVRNAYYNAHDTLLAAPCGALDIDRPLQAEASVRLVPNPATTHADVLSDVPVLRVAVRDMAGRLMYMGSATHLDTHAWPAGIYLVSIDTERGKKVCKMIR